MNKEFVTYEQALALEELGFDEECMADCMGYGNGDIENGTYKIEHTQIFYPDDWITPDDVAENLNLYCFYICGIPLKQQVFRWFREKYGTVFCYEPILKKDLTHIFFIYMEVTGCKVFVVESKYNEEAENACIDKLIELETKRQ